jgi:hypothetical protein
VLCFARKIPLKTGSWVADVAGSSARVLDPTNAILRTAPSGKRAASAVSSLLVASSMSAL